MEENNKSTQKHSSISRRKFMQNSGIIAAAGIAVSTGGMAVAQELGQDQEYKKGKTVPLNWNEVLDRSLLISRQVGIRAVEADAIDEKAWSFYVRYGFFPLLDDRRHLFLPMQAIRKLDLPNPA